MFREVSFAILGFVVDAAIWCVTGLMIIECIKNRKAEREVYGMKKKRKRHFGLGGKVMHQTQWEAEKEARESMELATKQAQAILDVCLECSDKYGRDVSKWDIFAMMSFATRMQELGDEFNK